MRSAIEDLNGTVVEGAKLQIEHCDKITPGRDPRTHNANSEFKNVTLVLKNLPFQLKQEKLEEILNGFKYKPQNVSYLYDPSGMFRGMAFVKYKETEHATRVFEEMNDMDILGRRVRIEYKRKTKGNSKLLHYSNSIIFFFLSTPKKKMKCKRKRQNGSWKR